MRTMEDLSFWDRVCEICGKIYEDEVSKMQHKKRHYIIVPMCELCGGNFSTNFTLHRHMVEQHNSFQNRDDFACVLCDKSFEYKRNLDVHIQEQGSEHQCTRQIIT